MDEQKQEIINTRKGFLGGSDAKMIMQVAELGTVPQSALKRLAVCKGFIEPEQFTNRAIEMGNFIEETVFNNLKASDERWQSNPRIVSAKYSRPNVQVLDHVDFMLQDDEKKVLTIAECKAVRTTFPQTRDEYKAQLIHHWLLGSELAKSLGNYKVVLVLCHYSTDGLDLDAPFIFDPSRLTVKTLRNMDKDAKTYNLAKGMDIINDFLETFDAYYTDDEIDAAYLPANVKTQFDDVTALLAEIKEREEKVAAFKEKLYEFLVAKNIKGIKNDSWSITRVDASTSSTFDAKKFLEEYTKEHPVLAEKLKKKYSKTTTKKGFCLIKLKTK